MRRLKDYLIPMPKKIEEGASPIAALPFGTSVRIALDKKSDVIKEAKKELEEKLVSLAAVSADGGRGSYTVRIKVSPQDVEFQGIDSPEAYYVKAGKQETVLVGKSDAGALYAAYTFADMLQFENNSLIIPDAYILDYPDYPYRGHTIESRYGTEFMTFDEYKNMIDYFSRQKLNRLVITLYDCWNYQYDSDPAEFLYMEIPGHPEIKTPKRIKYYSVKNKRWVVRENLLPSLFADKSLLGKVIAYAKKRNVVMLPQCNMLAHNTLIPRFIPEISAVNERGIPLRRGYCTAKPETYRLLYSMIDKMIDEYILPYGLDEIHFGLDEIQYRCMCPECRGRETIDIFIEHTLNLIKYAKARGMKHVYLCHDVFLTYNAVGDSLKQRFVDAGVDDVTVLDWWTYEDPTAGLFYGKADKVYPLLRSRIKPYSGYQNWMAIQDTTENIRGCLKLASGFDFEGVNAYTTFDPAFDKNFLTIADLAWNKSGIDDPDEFDRRYAEKYYPHNKDAALTALRAIFHMTHDSAHVYWQNQLNRWLDYYMYGYRLVSKEENENVTLTLKNYPGDAFSRLINSDRVDTAYLEGIRRYAKAAEDFLKNSGRYDLFNDTLLLNVRYYDRTADEFLTVLGLWREYNEGKAGADKVISELARLIGERESLMSFAEDVKIPHNLPTYLRNMTVVRQWLIDLRDYFVRQFSEGKRPVFDITNLDYAMSERFRFIR